MSEIVRPGRIDEDLEIELSLRPQKLSEFIGQTKVKDNL
jgi:Holliday junction resolvasome RuvABC ATP-dependent DNA helicase subunit